MSEALPDFKVGDTVRLAKWITEETIGEVGISKDYLGESGIVVGMEPILPDYLRVRFERIDRSVCCLKELLQQVLEYPTTLEGLSIL